MDELAKRSDFLAACCALTPETKEICNKDLFSKMKKTSIFINTSRFVYHTFIENIITQHITLNASKPKQINNISHYLC